MLSPMQVWGETILDADANNILMGVNRSMPSMFRLMFSVRIAFHRRSRKRTLRCPSSIGERFGPIASSKAARIHVPDLDQNAMWQALDGSRCATYHGTVEAQIQGARDDQGADSGRPCRLS